MFKWIKEILSYGSGRGYEEGSTILPELDTSLFAPMPEVKPPKSEYVDKFIEKNHDHVHPIHEPSIASIGLMRALIGTIHEQKELIEYLDTRIIDLERIIYK